MQNDGGGVKGGFISTYSILKKQVTKTHESRLSSLSTMELLNMSYL